MTTQRIIESIREAARNSPNQSGLNRLLQNLSDGERFTDEELNRFLGAQAAAGNLGRRTQQPIQPPQETAQQRQDRIFREVTSRSPADQPDLPGTRPQNQQTQTPVRQTQGDTQVTTPGFTPVGGFGTSAAARDAALQNPEVQGQRLPTTPEQIAQAFQNRTMSYTEALQRLVPLFGGDQQAAATYLGRAGTPGRSLRPVAQNPDGSYRLVAETTRTPGADIAPGGQSTVARTTTPGGLPLNQPTQFIPASTGSVQPSFAPGRFGGTLATEQVTDPRFGGPPGPPPGTGPGFGGGGTGFNQDVPNPNIPPTPTGNPGPVGDEPGDEPVTLPRTFSTTFGDNLANRAAFSNFANRFSGGLAGNQGRFLQQQFDPLLNAFQVNLALKRNEQSPTEFNDFLGGLQSFPGLNQNTLFDLSRMLRGNPRDIPGIQAPQAGALNFLRDPENAQDQFNLLAQEQLRGLPPWLRRAAAPVYQRRFDELIGNFGLQDNFQPLDFIYSNQAGNALGPLGQGGQFAPRLGPQQTRVG